MYKPWLRHSSKEGTGKMISEHPGRQYRGFHVNCMYSAAQAGNPAVLTRNLMLGEYSDEKKQEVFNSDLGLPVEIEGAKVTDLQIEKCARYMQPKSPIRTLGADVGKVFHVTIKEWYKVDGANKSIKINDQYLPHTLYLDEVYSWDEVWKLFKEYGCKAAVIDREPETHAALQFARRAWGKIYLCDYNHHRRGKTVTLDKSEATIFVNRTAWLDQILGRIKSKNVVLPVKRHLDYNEHLKALTRTTKRNRQTDEIYATYSTVGPDHFAHSDVYSELALPFALQNKQTWDIVDLF
jgi:hypothetical protein